jgi:hypothetical protein
MTCHRRIFALGASLAVVLTTGCGTTRWSDTSRTATEQMLMSDAIDRAVSEMDFSILAGRDIYLDSKCIAGMVDEKYVVGTLRQHMFATGCVLHDKAEDATCIVEVRAGALGTNRSDVLFGVPATQLPAGGAFIGAPTAIPELPLIKRTAQQGVCKLAVFAYDRMSGSPVWQSGSRQQVSKAKDVWVFGTGPFQHGTIYDGAKFAGERLNVPMAGQRKVPPSEKAAVSGEVVFQPVPHDPSAPARLAADPSPSSAVTPASATAPAGTSSSGSGSMASPIGTSVPAPASPAPAAGSPTSGTSTSSSSTNSSSNTSTVPNAAAGAVGAMQVVDWARTARPAR